MALIVISRRPHGHAGASGHGVIARSRRQQRGVFHQKLETSGIGGPAKVRALRLLTAAAFHELELLGGVDPVSADAQADGAAYAARATEEARAGALSVC